MVDLFPFNLAYPTMTYTSLLAAGLLLALSACATPPAPERPPAPVPSTASGAAVLLDELSRVAGLSPEQRRREAAALEGERRLDDVRRFQLAALLEREDSVDALERSLRNLNALGDADARSQALIELMKRSLRARIEHRQQSARAQELQEKLEQIKALEKSLQQRNGLPKAP